MGFDVLVEDSAGEGVFRSNKEYEKAGARIAPDAESVFAEANLVILDIKMPGMDGL